MLFLTLSTALLSAAPTSGLTLSAQLGKGNMPADAYLRAIEKEFLAAEVPVRRLTTKCDGERDCLLKSAGNEALPGVVAVTLAMAKNQTTIDLEALRVRDGSIVDQLTFVVKEKLEDNERWQIRAFAKRLAAALAPVAPVEPPPDAPLVSAADLLPPPKDDALRLSSSAAKPAPVPGIILGSAAGASAVVAAVFVGLGAGAQGQLASGTASDPATITRAEANRLADSANTSYSVALGCGLAAGALAVATIIYFAAQ